MYIVLYVITIYNDKFRIYNTVNTRKERAPEYNAHPNITRIKFWNNLIERAPEFNAHGAPKNRDFVF